MNCKNCGAHLEDGMLFCLECGTKVEPEEKAAEEKTEERVYLTEIRSALDKLETILNSAPKIDPSIAEKIEACERENAALKEENRSLIADCAKLKTENEMLQQKFAAIQSLFMGTTSNPAPNFAPTPVTEPEKKVCPNCGSQVEDGSLFCGECGTRI